MRKYFKVKLCLERIEVNILANFWWVFQFHHLFVGWRYFTEVIAGQRCNLLKIEAPRPKAKKPLSRNPNGACHSNLNLWANTDSRKWLCCVRESSDLHPKRYSKSSTWRQSFQLFRTKNSKWGIAKRFWKADKPCLHLRSAPKFSNIWKKDLAVLRKKTIKATNEDLRTPKSPKKRRDLCSEKGKFDL
jgi:hypothetical protein